MVWPFTAEWSYEKDMPDLSKHRVLITGGNTGIGMEAAKAFIEHSNAETVIIACRSEERANKAIEYIAKSAKNFKDAEKSIKDRIEFLSLDLADLDQVAKAAEELHDRFDRIDICINNAGIGFGNTLRRTKQGLEGYMGVNHVAHFFFNSRILDLLLKSKEVTDTPARIVSVASCMHEHSLGIDFENHWLFLGKERKADKDHDFVCYNDSKLANVQYALGMKKRLAERGLDDKLIVTSMHPGVGASELFREEGKVVKMLIETLAASPASLCRGEVRGATDPTFVTGTYTNPKYKSLLLGNIPTYGPPVLGTPTEIARNEAGIEKLWEETEKVLKETYFGSVDKLLGASKKVVEKDDDDETHTRVPSLESNPQDGC